MGRVVFKWGYMVGRAAVQRVLYAKRCGLIGFARKFFSGWNIGLHVLGFG
ncbi:hypothetical protein [Xylella fastidiosa]|nr:hypothetical protein [Xylella fastidiosa]